MDHLIYRDYISNRRSFVYCSLGCVLRLPISTGNQKKSVVSVVAVVGRRPDRSDCQQGHRTKLGIDSQTCRQ